MLLESCILPNCPMETKRSAGTAWGFSPLLQSRFNEIPFFSFFFRERHTGSISTALAETLHIWGWGCKKRSGHQLGFTVSCPVAAALGAVMGSKIPMGTGKTQELNPFPINNNNSNNNKS